MKFIMALIMCFSLNAFADHHEEMEKKMDSMSFEDAKKMKLEKLDKMQSHLDESRKCINETKDKDGLKACHQKMMDKKKKEWKGKMKGKKKDKKK